MEGYKRSRFLSERWEEKSRTEQGLRSLEDTQKERDIVLYERIQKEIAGSSEHLAGLLRAVERAAIRYRQSVNRFDHVRTRDANRADMQAELEETDRNRRAAHEVLIDSINILSRAYKKAGLDNDWRREIGVEREEVGRWGMAIANIIYRKFEERHHHDAP